MVRHPIDDDLDAALVRLSQQAVEGFQVAEQRVDVAVIRHVIAEVLHRRRIEWADPDRIDAERLGKIIQFFNDPRQVADPIPVGVFEAARIDLVDYPFLPPKLIHSYISLIIYIFGYY